eukprot:2654594-Pleurochrysis_carterae.AAC.2
MASATSLVITLAAAESTRVWQIGVAASLFLRLRASPALVRSPLRLPGRSLGSSPSPGLAAPYEASAPRRPVRKKPARAHARATPRGDFIIANRLRGDLAPVELLICGCGDFATPPTLEDAAALADCFALGDLSLFGDLFFGTLPLEGSFFGETAL